MLNFEEASKIIAEALEELKLRTEETNITNVLNRVLAEDIISDVDLPPFDNSAMDGYAIKFNMKVKEWKSIGEISAGNYENYSLDDSSTVHIMTGGKLPMNCDSVIPIENVDVIDENVKLKEGVKLSCGMNVRKKGEDLLKDSVAANKGCVLKPQQIAVAASCGKSRIKVFRKLNIGILTTGDELIDINKKPDTDKIRASNPYSLYSAIQDTNMNPINLGIVNDDRPKLLKKVKDALDKRLDVLLTSGGVSVGKYDFLKEVFEELGVEIKFWRVFIKPGKPLLFGIYKNGEHKTLIFGLPGNPVSALVTYIVFIKKNILKLFGNQELSIVQAVLKSNISKKDTKRYFIRGILKRVDTNLYNVTLAGEQSSGNLAQMGKANGLIIIEEEKSNPKIGETVKCIMI